MSNTQAVSQIIDYLENLPDEAFHDQVMVIYRLLPDSAKRRFWDELDKLPLEVPNEN